MTLVLLFNTGQWSGFYHRNFVVSCGKPTYSSTKVESMKAWNFIKKMFSYF